MEQGKAQHKGRQTGTTALRVFSLCLLEADASYSYLAAALSHWPCKTKINSKYLNQLSFNFFFFNNFLTSLMNLNVQLYI